MIFADGGDLKPVESIERIGSLKKPVVYNLAVSPLDTQVREEGQASHAEHMVEANGVVTGDLYLQEQLAGGPSAVANKESAMPTIAEVRAAVDEFFVNWPR